ncbi:MAG: TM0106 family RecB-like putative nuclease [Nitrospirae bacterium]|nr:TM0106 family RecB-like putative nuclease [Nitrospirota bacterium]
MENDNTMNITASKLYDFIQCPHKVWRDIYGPQEEKIQETNPFVQLLWERGVNHEERIIRNIGEFADLRAGSLDERFKDTLGAIKRGTPLIYQGVLKNEECLGIPDLLKRMPDGKYIPVDIKSGMGYEGTSDEDEEEGKPKKHYAVQLALYVELLERLAIPNTGSARIIDIHGNEIEYDLDQPMGKRTPMTWWQFFEQTKSNVKALLENEASVKPAIAGACKLCSWYNSCKKWSRENEDLTEIFYLGRSKRDVINEDLHIEKISDFCNVDFAELAKQKKKDKTFLRGIGESTINKLVTRAKIICITKKPVVYRKIEFPKVFYELFFDIEDDPTQEFVYMHGIYERQGTNGRFIHFTAHDNTRAAEKEAWRKFWDYIRSLPQDGFSVYYYSHHEKTTYRRLQKQYPDVVSSEEVELFFSHPNTIDLYEIVRDNTDWPLGSYSLKELAQYLGFKWRDETPSGALSIQWFNEFLKTKDETILNRILIYNEDDCKATMILKDALAIMGQ